MKTNWYIGPEKTVFRIQNTLVVLCNVLQAVPLFGIILDVVALEFDELIEAESAQCLSLPGILPANPSEILLLLIHGNREKFLHKLTGAG